MKHFHEICRTKRHLIRYTSPSMPYYFYLARCSDGSLYSGSCVDLVARESKHNEGKGAKYTRSRRPVQIVYHEEFLTLTEARRREAEIKTWSKMDKENLARHFAKSVQTSLLR